MSERSTTPQSEARRGRARRGLTAAAAALVAAAMLAGCGGEDDPAGGAAASTATATATAPDAGAPMTFAGAPGRSLSAGAYQTTTFSVPLSITLDDGWTAGGGELPDLVDLFRQGSGSAGLGFFAGARFVDIGADEGAALDPSDDPTAFLHGHTGLETGPMSERQLGGRPATAFDFAASGPPSSPPPPAGSALSTSFPLAALSDGNQYGLSAGERGRVIVVEATGGPLVILISAPGPEADEHLRRAERVLASLRLPGA
jgi:hypothetical protein